MKKNLITGLVTGMGAFAVITLAVWWFMHTNSYETYVTVTKPEQIAQQVKHPQDANKLTVLYVYKQGCSRCESVRRQVIGEIAADSKDANINFVMVNTRAKQFQKPVTDLGIDDDPTVAVYYRGRMIQQYTGLNTVELNTLLDYRSLFNAKRIPKELVDRGYIVNDITKNNRTVPYTEKAKLNVSF